MYWLLTKYEELCLIVGKISSSSPSAPSVLCWAPISVPYHNYWLVILCTDICAIKYHPGLSSYWNWNLNFSILSTPSSFTSCPPQSSCWCSSGILLIHWITQRKGNHKKFPAGLMEEMSAGSNAVLLSVYVCEISQKSIRTFEKLPVQLRKLFITAGV